jgi:hypothetical protein
LAHLGTTEHRQREPNGSSNRQDGSGRPTPLARPIGAKGSGLRNSGGLSHLAIIRAWLPPTNLPPDSRALA